jgi:peptidoglycan/LPS O-acetylase OafA/YrhL
VARLWPLHLLTLMLVAVLQAAYAGLNGTDFIYHQNNLKHFLLSLPLMQYWGWQDNQSFNGPSWSLSTEMLAYAVFWLTLPACAARRWRWGCRSRRASSGRCSPSCPTGT